jgi:SAM-dependent methyltransferase
LVLPRFRRDPRYLAEFGRYRAIAGAKLENYSGYLDTKPRYRARLMDDMLKERDVREFVDVGPGPGFLQEETTGLTCWAMDHCLGFLRRVKERAPGTRCVRALAERMPFATGSVPCLVSDSTFQTLVDRESFLCEAARVCAPGALFMLSVGYRANYPRRPQDGFNVLRPEGRELLFHYVKELGFDESGAFFWNVAEKRRVADMEDGDYFYVVAEKTRDV